MASIASPPALLRDSMAFEGRTPCEIPGIIPSGSWCYKLKWSVILYANVQINKPKNFKVHGTAWRKKDGREGTWQIISGKNGQTIYQLNDGNRKGLLYLLKLDEHILVFTDSQGKLLVGDEDFSYTLNRKY